MGWAGSERIADKVVGGFVCSDCQASYMAALGCHDFRLTATSTRLLFGGSRLLRMLTNNASLLIELNALTCQIDLMMTHILKDMGLTRPVQSVVDVGDKHRSELCLASPSGSIPPFCKLNTVMHSEAYLLFSELFTGYRYSHV
jgi:hypothetical protein